VTSHYSHSTQHTPHSCARAALASPAATRLTISISRLSHSVRYSSLPLPAPHSPPDPQYLVLSTIIYTPTTQYAPSGVGVNSAGPTRHPSTQPRPPPPPPPPPAPPPPSGVTTHRAAPGQSHRGVHAYAMPMWGTTTTTYDVVSSGAILKLWRVWRWRVVSWACARVRVRAHASPPNIYIHTTPPPSCSITIDTTTHNTQHAPTGRLFVCVCDLFLFDKHNYNTRTPIPILYTRAIPREIYHEPKATSAHSTRVSAHAYSVVRVRVLGLTRGRAAASACAARRQQRRDATEKKQKVITEKANAARHDETPNKTGTRNSTGANGGQGGHSPPLGVYRQMC